MDLLVLTWMLYLKSSTRKMIKKKTLITEEKKKSVSRRNDP
jgi:hypothetical protein